MDISKKFVTQSKQMKMMMMMIVTVLLVVCSSITTSILNTENRCAGTAVPSVLLCINSLNPVSTLRETYYSYFTVDETRQRG